MAGQRILLLGVYGMEMVECGGVLCKNVQSGGISHAAILFASPKMRTDLDKSAEIQRDKKGNVIYDKTTAETEIVKIEEDINDYMDREVLPHVPDAVAFFEEVITEKKTVIKTGADIAFTRYFYQYQQPEASQNLEKKFLELDKSVNERIHKLFGGI